MQRLLHMSDGRLEIVKSNEAISDPFFIIKEKLLVIDELTLKLEESFKAGINCYKTEFKHLSSRLNSLSPLNILARGYSFCTDSNGRLINDSQRLSLNEEVSVKLRKGGFNANVIKIEEN